MTGSFPPAVGSAVSALDLTDTAGPSASASTADDATTHTPGQGAAATGSINTAAGVYGTPYQLQTGPTRYAPMPAPPGSVIGGGKASAQYPSSVAVLATAALAVPTVVTTVTQPLTGSATTIGMMVNTVGSVVSSFLFSHFLSCLA